MKKILFSIILLLSVESVAADLSTFKDGCNANDKYECQGFLSALGDVLIVFDGKEKYEKMYTKDIIDTVEHACNIGVGKACERMASLHMDGIGFNENMDKADEYHEKACNMGYQRSCYSLGLTYLYGNRGDKSTINYHKAIKYLKDVCDAEGDSTVCILVGQMYQNGLGTRQDFQIAKKYFGKSCDSGSQKGCDLYKTLNVAGH